MDVTPLVKQGAKIIQSYADGRFRVSGEVFERAVFVAPSFVEPWDIQVQRLKELEAGDFQFLIEKSSEIDVVLLGCGKQIQFMPVPLRNALKQQGLSVDVMDTGAACRTYNVLMAEGRRVVAALLPF